VRWHSDVTDVEEPALGSILYAREVPDFGDGTLFANMYLAYDALSDGMRRTLLDYLYRHLERPEFTCRFRWSANAIAFWDNRCVQHYAINDYHGQRRVMYRVTVNGDRPY
jgi:taurine dioxygenase